MATRIFWKEDEKLLLVQSAATRILDGAASSRLSALQQSQEVLPEDRQRHIQAMSVVPWYEDMLASEISTQKRQRKNALEAQRVEEEIAAKMPAPDPLAIAMRHVVDLMRVEIARAIQEAFQGLPGVSPGEAITEMAKALKPVAQPRRRSVCIAGLKGQQMEVIRREFEPMFDLRFHGSNDSKHQLRSLAEGSDVTVGVASFLDHSSTDIISARSPQPVLLHGGMVKLKETLRGLMQ